MGFPVGQPIPIRYYTGATGQTVLARIVDEVDGAFGGELTLTENAALNALGYPGFYETTWTPDMAGHWKVLIKVGGVVYGQLFYYVGQGVGVDVSWYKGYCDAGMGASTTNIVCAGLAGLGDDFFNTDWVMVVNLNINAVGVAPEGQIRDITNYVSATGTFTTVAFGANVEANDCIIVARREFFTVDGVALQAVPTTNSLAYRISQYLATGDGDWVGGTALPSNVSLYDVLRVLAYFAHATGVPTTDSLLDYIMNKDGGQTFNRAADSLERLGEITLETDTRAGTIIGYHAIPGVDAVTNSLMRDIIGNKTDTPTFFQGLTSSLMRYQKAILASSGMTFMGVCDSGMGASQTIIVSDDLAGFGEDFFNTNWVMIILHNVNNDGNSPEGDTPKDITNYVSATGTFTTAAFGANVEEGDVILVARRDLFFVARVALPGTPATNSLARRISEYLADGDGDFAAGTALPSNKSLYDRIRELTHQVDDVVIYPVAEDMGTTEITDDGTSPALTAQVSKSAANEGAGEADPSWVEDIDFEQQGTITTISIYYELRWQQKYTAGGASTNTWAKWQISDDGGSTWVDVTDNETENNPAYQDKTKIGVGRHITTIDAGANQLQLRLVAWTDDGAASVETKVRSDTYIRVTYRKS